MPGQYVWFLLILVFALHTEHSFQYYLQAAL